MFRLVGALPAARVASTRMDRAGALPDSLELSWCVWVGVCARACVQVSFWLPHPWFRFLKRVPEWKGCGEILPEAGLGWAWGLFCPSSKRGALSGPRGSLETKEDRKAHV